MSSGRAWSVAFFVGVAAFFGTPLAVYLPPVVAAFLAATGLFGERLAGVSGVLVGFGGTWCVFVGWQMASGGRNDQGALVLAPGALPFAIGVLIGAIALARET